VEDFSGSLMVLAISTLRTVRVSSITSKGDNINIVLQFNPVGVSLVYTGDVNKSV
jgi:hypothetical protein